MEANPFPASVPNAIWHPITMNILAATPSQDIFVCPPRWFCRIRGVSRTFAVASTSGTVMVEVLTAAADQDAGVDQLTAALALSGTADTVANGVLIRSPTVIKPGMRVGIVIGGTMTNLVGCCLTVLLEVLNRGQS